MCALGRGPTEVGSCEWDPVPSIAVSGTGTVENVTRMIRDGALLTILVADPGSRIVLPDVRGNVAARERRFFIGVTSETGRYRRAELVSHSPVLYVFQVTIPRRRSVRLFIDSDLRITDSSGSPIETKQRSSRQVSPGSADRVTLDLRVNQQE